MKFKIHITTDQGELLNTIEVDTNDKYWDSINSKQDTMHEIFDEIYRAVERLEPVMN